MALGKIEKNGLMGEAKLKEIAFRRIKSLFGRHYEINEHNLETIDEEMKWSKYVSRYLYRLNINLIQSFPLKIFYEKFTGELIGMFDGSMYDIQVRSKGSYIFNVDRIAEIISSEIKIPENAKIYKQEVVDHDMINVDVLHDAVFPPRKYLHLEWRHKDSTYFQKQLDKNSGDIEDIDEISKMFIEAYYNLDTNRLVCFFKNWKCK